MHLHYFTKPSVVVPEFREQRRISLTRLSLLVLMLQVPNVIDGTVYSVRLGAMRAAVKRISSLDSMADYLAATMGTDRRKFMYRTLERIEYMSISRCKHLKRKVVIISANFTLSHNVSFLCIIFS
jgi:hypothetical protein